jgi:RsiW-degrading membrane proteinase PrsW (M82 family)
MLSKVLVTGTPAYTIMCVAFIVVAVVGEGREVSLLLWRTWRDQIFNYFSRDLLCLFVSLGFAAFENISYVVGYGLTTAIARAVLAIPAHMGFAVFMGYFYARAKRCHDAGNAWGRRRNLWAAFITAVLLHGFYDACALLGTVLSLLLFLAFVIAMYIIVIRR